VKVLVLNCGSSNLKFELIETSPELAARDLDRRLARGSVEKIGSEEALLAARADGWPALRRVHPIPGILEAVRAVRECLEELTAEAVHLDAVGHRVVHGGVSFTRATRLDAATVPRIERLSELAPLHNPLNLKGYYAVRELYPELPQVAVFDTAFHGTLPPKAYLYAIPEKFVKRDRIRKYGFHGTSARYVATRYARLMGVEPAALKLIVCHLGSGCSVTAIERGRSVDTSMGFTPLEGLVMGTRSGDIDPAAVMRMMDREGVGTERIQAILNRECGLLALSGETSDMRRLMELRAQGHDGARRAIEVFCYRVRKYVGAYLAVLNGADAILFTGGVGEHQPLVRAGVCDNLEALGIELEAEANHGAIGVEAEISAITSRVKVWVIPTHEELVIARETMQALSGGASRATARR
jgi:acetate kinase